MYATERQGRIIGELEESGRVSVASLSRSFDVTAETIRRDLDALEAAGALRRVHGGAVRWATAAELGLDERRDHNRAAKRAIAKAALRMLPSSVPASIAIDAGTTTGVLAELLADWRPADDAPGSLDVMTNAIPIVATLHHNPRLAVHVVGGRVRPTTSAAVGWSAIEAFARVRPDIAFIGANGIAAEFGLSTPDEAEAAVKTAIVRSARRVIALLDAGKQGVESLYRFASLAEIDTLVTDRQPDPDLAAALRDADVDVVLA